MMTGPALLPIDDVPGAMQTHFSAAPLNCYALAEEQVTGPLSQLIIAQDFRSDYARAEFETRQETRIWIKAFGTNPFADGPDLAQNMDAHCRITGAHLHCFMDGDSGRFDLYDAGYDEILLRVYWIVGMVEDTMVPTDAFDPARYGATFLLSRLNDGQCLSIMGAE